MTKHKPILTDAEMHTLICGNLLPVGLSLDRLESFARNVEQYVLKKLAEQEPAFYSYAGGVYAADSMDMCDYTREYGTPLYAHPMPNGQVNLDSSNHIADMRKMVADMYWISDEFSTETILDAFDPIVGMIDVSVGDTFEVKRAKTLPSITVEVTEMTEYGDVKAYKVVGGDHIPDASKMVVPDGWQLVPIEPTDSMLASARYARQRDQADRSSTIYRAMLAAAPKYKGGSNE